MRVAIAVVLTVFGGFGGRGRLTGTGPVLSRHAKLVLNALLQTIDHGARVADVIVRHLHTTPILTTKLI